MIPVQCGRDCRTESSSGTSLSLFGRLLLRLSVSRLLSEGGKLAWHVSPKRHPLESSQSDTLLSETSAQVPTTTPPNPHTHTLKHTASIDKHVTIVYERRVSYHYRWIKWNKWMSAPNERALSQTPALLHFLGFGCPRISRNATVSGPWKGFTGASNTSEQASLGCSHIIFNSLMSCTSVRVVGLKKCCKPPSTWSMRRGQYSSRLKLKGHGQKQFSNAHKTLWRVM